ncbi:hypothetical protein Golomagni_05537 [Golovinomyces magnicellulatus]|nr:hypothetical protein Golomagni_05537 [Golovinomyces magnicellulatus]
MTILQEKFFPRWVEAGLSDISKITAEDIEGILASLLRGKAPGPDEIRNEMPKVLLQEWSQMIADAVSNMLNSGSIPPSFKESTTLAIRKDRCPDYSIPSSYRPIALENSSAELVQKVIANRMAIDAERHSMLLWT